MSASRRIELLNWALANGAWIVEDEYDAEYRYFGKPVASLQSLDQSGSVIYIGTFTKMLFNALRLGFLVVPERLVDAFVAARSYMDRHPATLDQAVLAEFITEGYFGQHVRKMRQVYAERMAVLKDAAQTHLQDVLEVEDAEAGMRTVAWIKGRASDKMAAQRASQHGIETIPLSDFTIKHIQQPALLLGFAGCSPEELQRGASVLATALRSKNAKIR
jgi:GntR family transcriptional regulator/MocR family aminotransferase